MNDHDDDDDCCLSTVLHLTLYQSFSSSASMIFIFEHYFFYQNMKLFITSNSLFYIKKTHHADRICFDQSEERCNG